MTTSIATLLARHQPVFVTRIASENDCSASALVATAHGPEPQKPMNNAPAAAGSTTVIVADSAWVPASALNFAGSIAIVAPGARRFVSRVSSARVDRIAFSPTPVAAWNAITSTLTLADWFEVRQICDETTSTTVLPTTDPRAGYVRLATSGAGVSQGCTTR